MAHHIFQGVYKLQLVMPFVSMFIDASEENRAEEKPQVASYRGTGSEVEEKPVSVEFFNEGMLIFVYFLSIANFNFYSMPGTFYINSLINSRNNIFTFIYWSLILMHCEVMAHNSLYIPIKGAFGII